MKRVGILYDNISGNIGDQAIGISVRKMLGEIGVDFEELVPGRFNPADYPAIVVGGGQLLRPSPDFFYDKFRIPGAQILNSCGIFGFPEDLEYLSDYLYLSVRSRGDKQKLSYLKNEVKVVPCTTMLLGDSREFLLEVKEPSIGVHLWGGLIDEGSFIEYFSNQPFHIYFIPITHYVQDFNYLAKLSQKVKNSTLLPILKAEEIFTIIGKFDYFISASLHGAIFAYVHGVPFALYDTGDDKMRFFLEDRGLGEYVFKTFADLKSIFERFQTYPPDYSSSVNNDFEALKAHKEALKDILSSGFFVTRKEIAADLNLRLQEGNFQISSLQRQVESVNAQAKFLQFEIKEKYARIKSLELNLEGKAKQINLLNNNLLAKNAHISELNNTLQTRDIQINSLEANLEKKDKQINSINVVLQTRDAQIGNIVSSFSWRITRPLRFFGKIIGIRQNKETTTHRLKRRLVRLIVSTYSSSALIRRCVALGESISNKLVGPMLPALHNRVFMDSKLYLKQQWLNDSGGSSYDTSVGLYSLPNPSQEEFYPKVSIIVPNYNHESYLRHRLDSVYQQTYQNIEVILLDDASNDESTQILEEYRQRYPNITRCCFNNKNSGGVFHQWEKGIELAQGELIWIAESDDYCSENMLEELVKFFANEAVMLAFCKTVFVDGDTTKQIWSLEEYLADLADPLLWSQRFVKSAHQLVNTGWAVKNIIPNVSSAVFKNPGKLDLLGEENWRQMRICGDWIFYLHVIRGGLVAYSPNANNYFRMHKKNTSVETYKQDIYYREHEKVAEELVQLYRLEEGLLEKQRLSIELHWRLHRTDYSENHFKECYDLERIKHLSKNRKPNLLMVTFALAAGGGETFPIKLVNLMKSAGYGVTLLNCHREITEPGIRKMVRRDVPLLELDRFDKLNNVINDLGIEIVHSHHAWVDVTICTLLENNPNCKIVITTHGMYEMMSPTDLARVVPLLSKRVNKFVYAAEKNLDAFNSNVINGKRFTKIDNALEKVPIVPVPREELGINEDDFVLCLVSRSISEKGWEEGIKAVKYARKISGKEIHLLLIGEGPEYKRLRRQAKDRFIHFLGFRANIRDYFATSDMGFLPSKFHGESFPLVIIDSLQSNRPVLASNVGEIANMIKTDLGPAGSTFSLENWQIPIKRVGELIAAYATNRNLYSEHLNRVPEAAKKFDPNNMLHSYEMVYQEVVGDTMTGGKSDSKLG
jgi:glycosyltransferase involved in cell wall biosynthesis